MATRLEPTDAHQDFVLDKKEIDDPTIGLPNQHNILCAFTDDVLIPAGNAIKVHHEVDLIQNTMREFDMCSTYWYVDSLTKFENIEVHQIDGNMKYLCSLSCQSAILGYQVIS